MTDTKVIIMKPAGGFTAACIVRSHSVNGGIRLSFDVRSIPFGPGIIAASASLESGEVYAGVLSVRGRSASGEVNLPEMPSEIALAYMPESGAEEPVFFLIWGRRLPGRMEARRVKALAGVPSKAEPPVKPDAEQATPPEEAKDDMPDETISFDGQISEQDVYTPEPEADEVLEDEGSDEEPIVEEPEEAIFVSATEPVPHVEEPVGGEPLLEEAEEAEQEAEEPVLGEDEAFPEREEAEAACEAVPESAAADGPFVLPDSIPPGNARDAARIFHELAQNYPLVRPFQIQGTRFVQVDCPGVSWGSHYIIGMGAKNGLPTVFYIGVPGKYQLYPPPGLEGYRYMSSDDGQGGYWMKATSLE